MLRSPLINHLLRHYELGRSLLARQPLLARFGADTQRQGRAAGIRFAVPYQPNPVAALRTPLRLPEALGASETASEQPEAFEPLAIVALPQAGGPMDHTPAVPQAQPAVPPSEQLLRPSSPPALRRAASAPPTAAELRDTLLALRAQPQQPAARPKPHEPGQPGPSPELPSRPRVPLGRRVVHLPGINPGPAASEVAAGAPEQSPGGQAEPGGAEAVPPAPVIGQLPALATEIAGLTEAVVEPPDQSDAASPPMPEPPAEPPATLGGEPDGSTSPDFAGGQSGLFSAGLPVQVERLPAAQPALATTPMPVDGSAEAAPRVIPAAEPAAPGVVPVAPAAVYERAAAGVAERPDQSARTQQAPLAQAGTRAGPGAPAGQAFEWPKARSADPSETPSALAGAAQPGPPPGPAAQPEAELSLAIEPGSADAGDPAGQASEPAAVPGAESNQRAEHAEARAGLGLAREDASAALTGSMSASEPPREGVRRRLRPLLGIDLADVRIHSDAPAQQLAQAYRADAIAIGTDIALAAGVAGDSPAAQGLLAHELAHVARSQRPRFVPPIARAAPAPADEEQLAELVEAQVGAIVAQPTTAPDGWVAATASSPAHKPSPGQAAPERLRDRASWHGLPAPWEPLPAAIALPLAGTLPASTPAGDTAVSAVTMSSTAAEPPVARAAQDRPALRAKSQAPPPAAAPSQAEPDLDALARQIYALLKQRLAAERRRYGR